MNKKKSYTLIFENSMSQKMMSYNINYHVRIHDSSMCKCNRIKHKCSQNKNNSNQKLIFTIEKLWNDSDKYKSYPNKIFIYGNADEKSTVLNEIFQNHLVSRKKVHDYFREYKWCAKDSEEIRKIVNNMSCVCFCRYNLLANETLCNAAIVLIGDRTKMNSISHGFNKYVEKTEFSKLLAVSLGNLVRIPKKKRDHDIQLFIDSSEINELSDLLYTIVGQKNNIKYNTPNDNNEIKYSFSFGKREWFHDYPETSLECAKRELYEEYNIQLSENIFKYSATIKNPQKIYQPGTILYLVYIPFETTITYYRNSNTMYLDC